MTTARSTTFPHTAFPSRPARTDGVLVVAGAGDVPDWVVRWCRESGRKLRRQPELPSMPGESLAAAEGGGAIEAIAEATGTGATILALSEPDSARPGPRRVVVAVQDLPDDEQALAEAATAAAYMDAHLVVAHGVPTSFGERSVGLDAAVDQARSLLDAAVEQASAAVPGLTVEPWLARVHPHELVGEGLDADLLVAGGRRVNSDGAPDLVARSALHHAPCAVLLIPRPARRDDGLPEHCGWRATGFTVADSPA